MAVKPDNLKPDAESIAPNLTQKKCRYCCEDMPDRAVFCLKCEKFQNFYFHLLSSFNVSTVISILPMIALTFAFVSDKVVPKRSEIYSVVFQCSVSSVHVLFGNSGNRPAVIIPGSLRVEPSGDREIIRDLWIEDKSVLQVEPAKTTTVNFSLDRLNGEPIGPMPPMKDSWGKACKYVMHVGIVDSGNKVHREDRFECPCPE